MALLTVLGMMVSKDAISAEGKIITPVYWSNPRMYTLGYFLLQKHPSYYVVEDFKVNK